MREIRGNVRMLYLKENVVDKIEVGDVGYCGGVVVGVYFLTRLARKNKVF